MARDRDRELQLQLTIHSNVEYRYSRHRPGGWIVRFPGGPVTTTETPLDLEAADHLLYIASREVASIPYTAPEVLSARMRQVVPLAQDLSAELVGLRAQRDAALAACDEADRIAHMLWPNEIRAALGVQPEPDND
jgi:hypothetical protein